MKTKTIFKTLALTMMMPAMMLTTACSSDDDAIINNETPAKKGYELPVTINVTRQSDATRATYNESNKKLEFSLGDKLFVSGYTSKGNFAGTLNYVENSGGTFSGTITTQEEYSGTAETLLSQSDNRAVLLPYGYEPYGFLSIEGDGYNSTLVPDYTKAFADSKAAAVAQFSYEYAEDYSSSFTLAPKSAILNFSITGLTASTDVNVVLTDGGEINFNKTVTTDESGTATFAIGVDDYSDLNSFSLTVGGKAITLASSSRTLEAGHIYNITRSVLQSLTVSAYDSYTDATYSYTIYYGDDETWAEAIENHPTENAGWVYIPGAVAHYTNQELYITLWYTPISPDGWVGPNEKINKSSSYGWIFPWADHQ